MLAKAGRNQVSHGAFDAAPEEVLKRKGRKYAAKTLVNFLTGGIRNSAFFV